MGLIKKIFGGLFAFLGSLFGVLGKLVGANKSEFYMELEDDGDSLPSATQVTSSNLQPTQPPQPAPQSTPTPVPDTPLVKAQPAKAAAPEKPEPQGNFAPDYLVNPRLDFTPRRRPGACMSGFLDMAKSVNNKAA